MSWITVLLNKPNLIISLDEKTIRIDQKNHGFKRIPLKMIDKVIVEGKPLISSDVWRALTEYNIPAVIMPVRGKGPSVYLSAGLSSKGIINRMHQHKAIQNKKTSLSIARWLLRKKLEGHISLVQMLSAEKTVEFCNQMKCYIEKLYEADSQNNLMGYEGAAAILYFKTLAQLIDKKWKFSGRNKRPPRDPVNALLSLGYVIACSEIHSIIQKKGLDPATGFLHATQMGRDSMILDILEAIRPSVDYFVLQLLSQLTLNDFRTSVKDGCRLTKTGRQVFYSNWGAWQQSGEFMPIKSSTKAILENLISLFPES